MATGDLKNNLGVLKTELRHVQYTQPLDVAKLSVGDPVAILPLLHYILLDFSPFVARFLAQRGYDLYGKKDVRFLETIYRILRDEFQHRPVLTKAQFFTMGFAERKLQMLALICKNCRELHSKMAKGSQSTVLLPIAPSQSDSQLSVPEKVAAKPFTYKYVDVGEGHEPHSPLNSHQHQDSLKSLDTITGVNLGDRIERHSRVSSRAYKEKLSPRLQARHFMESEAPKQEIATQSPMSTAFDDTENRVITQLVDSNSMLIEQVMRLANQMSVMQSQIMHLQTQVGHSSPSRAVTRAQASSLSTASSPADPEKLVSKFYGFREDASPVHDADKAERLTELSPEHARKHTLAMEEHEISELSQPFQRHQPATPYLDVNPFSIPNRLSLEKPTTPAEISVYGVSIKSPKATKHVPKSTQIPLGSSTEDYIKAIAERLQQTKELLSSST